MDDEPQDGQLDWGWRRGKEGAGKQGGVAAGARTTVVTSRSAGRLRDGLRGAHAGAGSKALLEYLTRAMAKEFGARDMSVNIVAPRANGHPVLLPQQTPEGAECHQSQAPWTDA
ncbi:hypothetical protein [Nocardia transvalensis]|uniref:hypothetical protein n=1 Tax=Nocardia transvalensis TaxID=37333 RepID=UPI0018930AEF|nr:hypothetical protein [Nocardia transvalensis]MBF6331831.1 hypothetical protein [Nocardia transvalensis]